jgi:hypothetical protein
LQRPGSQVQRRIVELQQIAALRLQRPQLGVDRRRARQHQRLGVAVVLVHQPRRRRERPNHRDLHRPVG